MKAPKIPSDEDDRLKALEAFEILDTLPELEFDEITQSAAEICDTPIALISLVDRDRQWFKSKQGLEASETSRAVSFCGHAINNPKELFEISDSTKDPRFHDNPLVTDHPNVIYYLGAPLLTSDGHALGTLCVIDNKPRQISDEAKTALKSLSQQVICKLEFKKQNLELESINERLRVEIEEHKKTEAKLTAARDRAVEANRIKDQFLANMSHEIRTPLNGVVGITGLLLGNPRIEPEQKELLQDLDFSAHHLLRILNDILDLTRIRENRLQFKAVDFELPKFLNNLFRLLFESAEEKGIDFITDLDNKIPTFANGDPDRLGQIILNIAGNAIKFTEEGSVGINIRVLSKKTEQLRIQFEVVDTGIGIPKENLERIFELFSQSDAGVNRKYGGSGLGLPIAKSLIEQFGGTLDVESTVGLGSTFRFTVQLERAKGTGPLPLEQKASPIEEQKVSGKPLEILLVEDNVMNQKVASRNLDKFGFQTHITANGQEALDALNERSFDLILMDINMPVMDGIETTRRIRASRTPYKDIKIMAWTASVLNEDTQAILEAGMDDFISKPFRPQELYDKIMRLTTPPTD